MVRNYVRKTTAYDKEAMSAAVSLMVEGQTGYKKAAKLHDLKWQTVRDHVKKRNQKMGAGRNTALSSAEELELATCLSLLSRWGFGMTVVGDTDNTEIDALIGIFQMTGAQKQSKVSTLVIWAPHIGQDYVRATMSRTRYFQLVNALRFDQKTSRLRRQATDKLAAFREILDTHRYYTPGPYLTVDEQLIPFRGRCSFIQYIPSKPGKYGLKLFWVCDAENAYPLRCLPYVGNDPLRPQPRDVSHGASVVLTVAEPFLGKGRNIAMDTFFTDTKLLAILENRKTTLVGTVWRNKRFLPLSFPTKRGKNCMSQHLRSQRIACWSVIKAIATKMWWYSLKCITNLCQTKKEKRHLRLFNFTTKQRAQWIQWTNWP